MIAGLILQDSLGRQITFGFTDFFKNPLVENLPTSGDAVRGENNLTDVFIQKISEEVKANNLDGFTALPDGTSGIKIPDAANVNQWLAEQIKNFDPETLKPAVADEAIKINPDESEAAIRDYLGKLQEIINNNSSAPLWDENFDIQTAGVTDFVKILERLTLRYDKAIAELYNLTVPQNLLNFHKEEIRLTSAQAKIFKMLRDYQQDPLQTLIVASAQQKISNDFEVLLNELLKFLKLKNINLL